MRTRAYKLTQNGKEIAYVASPVIARRSLAISYSAFEELVIVEDLISITIQRKGFQDIRYVLEPIDILTEAEHL